MDRLPSRLPNYYARLGGWRVMSALELKELYRPLARRHHPDRGGDEERFKLLSEADGVLQDADKRAEYHARLTLTAPICFTCKAEGCVYKQQSFTQRTAKVCSACQGAGFLLEDTAWYSSV